MTAATAIVVAAGSGERFGGVPKAFVELAGRPLLAHCMQALAASEIIDAVVVIVAPPDLDRARAVARDQGFAEAAACAGGGSRQESVANGLRSCMDADVVAVHDAARPLVSAELVRRTVTALEDGWDGVAPALPVVDTLKQVGDDGAGVERTVERTRLRAVQTPQVFQRTTLQRAHDHFRLAAPMTDDLGLVERAGGRIRLVEGERRNLKITYPEDLIMAEALLRSGGPA